MRACNCTYGNVVSLTLAAVVATADTGRAEQPPAAINPAVEPKREAVPADAAPIERVDFDWYSGTVEERIQRLLQLMTFDEKVGQLSQISSGGDALDPRVAQDIRHGRIGSLFYTGNPDVTREAKRIALEESRLGIPLLAPRDVIHGFRTVFPIPLGQAASWNPELIEEAAHVAAGEARAAEVNWTFAPMLDVCRDARWGRIAESPGEDPLLASAFALATVRGYQKDGPHWRGIAACAKHFVAYGLSEGGRDYNRAQVANSELHHVFLAPFRAAVDADCLTVMSGFNTINGIPATGHQPLLRGVLKDRWGFDGLVVSDWSSVVEMIEHGYVRDEQHAAAKALQAGIDMEMATSTFREHLRMLVEQGELQEETIDEAVERVLRVKIAVALPPEPPAPPAPPPLSAPTEQSLALARKLARQSVVLLKNDDLLPLDAAKLKRVAVIGPLADAPRDQLGCWMLDGRPEEAVTPLAALREALTGKAKILAASGLESSTDQSTDGLSDAVAVAQDADVAIVFVGEGWWLSGEARSRVELSLPGAQSELVRQVANTGTPVVLVCLAGRPLTIGEEVDLSSAVLFAWHPGTMGGPAIADLLLGVESPSGKLPVTFPKHVGQSPLYYNHPRTGRPPLPGTQALIGSDRADFPEPQKYRSHYIDSDPFPLFSFGFGLAYTQFEYGEVELSASEICAGQTLAVRVKLTNVGKRGGEEVAQLYVRDVTASLVRPVRELKAFRRVRLAPGESSVLEFALDAEDLAYFDNHGRKVLEPGEFRLGVGGDSTAPLSASFQLKGGRTSVTADEAR